MYKPYKKPTITALPDVSLPEPRISKLVFLILWFLSRIYIRILFGFAKVVPQGDELFHAFKRALAGESRCIIAFRHPNGGEPQLLGWFFLFRLKAFAAKKKIRFAKRPHALFVYGYEVARWGGRLVRYILPNMGAMPIYHAKMDSKGMARINRAIVEGQYPVALAPEGQVSYTTDSLPRLEAGVIRIGFQAAQALADNNVHCPLEILPVSIQFRYGSCGERSMKKLLAKTERRCGFNLKAVKKITFEERLDRCRNRILEINEERYHLKVESGSSDHSLSFEERLELVVNAALETAERMLGIENKHEADFFSRLYKVRQICWDRIYLPEIDNLNSVTPVKRSMLDTGAAEAWYVSRHQELADFGWYFRRPLPTQETALHNKVEYVQNLWDFANRTMGGALADKINIFPKRIIIQSAKTINLSERLPHYKEDKKAAIASGLSDLEKSYLDSI